MTIPQTLSDSRRGLLSITKYHGFGIKMFNELNGKHGVWQKATLSNDMSVSELMKAFKGYEEGYKKQMMFHMETAGKLQDIGVTFPYRMPMR